MRDLYSIEAEHGVLGAMMRMPELIDILTEDLKASDFYLSENAEVYRAIQALQADSKPVDYFTVAEKIGILADGTRALGYTAEIVNNTPSVANAKEYALIVRGRAIDRAIIDIGQRITNIAHANQPAEEKISAIQAEVMSVDAEAATAEILDAWDVLSDHMDTLQRREELNGEIDGLLTGIDDLDQMLQGLRPEQLIIVAGRPGMGKTTLAMNIGSHAAVRQRKSVLVVSLEMSNGQLMDRFLASEGRVPLQDIKAGRAFRTAESGIRMQAAAGKLKDSGLRMSDRPGMTMNKIRAAARRQKRRTGLDLIIIDYLQLIESDSRNENRVTEVSAISRGAKLMARELQCPVIMLSQLSRNCEQRPNKRPVPSDLRESGAIEQDADVILFVYRDEVYHPESEYKGVAEVIIGKGRDIETGTVRCLFEGQFSTFSNITAEKMDEISQAANRKQAGQNEPAPLARHYGKRGQE